MIPAQIPQNEKARLDALFDYQILDTQCEKDFDDITALASQICDAPISLVTLLDKDRQWFKSAIGLDATETPREDSFCAHAINSPNENFIIEDATKDVRFVDNPFVVGMPHVRSYAGVPLVDPNGFALGTLCVIDNKPKKLKDYQIKALEKLANQVLKLLELRKKNFELIESHNTLLSRYKDLEQFSAVISHDIKSPLNNIILLTNMLRDQNPDQLSEEAKLMIEYIATSSKDLKSLVDGILNYYKYDNLNVAQRQEINLHNYITDIIALLGAKDFEFILPNANIFLLTNKIALGHILQNLISNSIKYNDKAQGIIEIGYTENPDYYFISVKDNGSGIDPAHFKTIFKLFQTLGKTDRFHSKGTGIGLSSIKKMIDRLGGTIEVESVIGMGTTFKIALKK